jgi:hypothetical protein
VWVVILVQVSFTTETTKVLLQGMLLGAIRIYAQGTAFPSEEREAMPGMWEVVSAPRHEEDILFGCMFPSVAIKGQVKTTYKNM